MIDRGAACEGGRAAGDRLAFLTGGSRGPRWRRRWDAASQFEAASCRPIVV